MNSFWKNEWKLFTNEVDTAMDFLMQPVTFSKKPKENLMIKATNEEIIEKAESDSFWKNQWNMFTNEVDTAMDFLMQPISFK